MMVEDDLAIEPIGPTQGIQSAMSRRIWLALARLGL
jgi:hypothetical protein